MKVRGAETPNHNANTATSVENGMAAELPSPHSIKFITKNITKTVLESDYDVRNLIKNTLTHAINFQLAALTV